MKEAGSSQLALPTSYFTRPLITVLFLGFSSGLPFALTGATLGFWLADTDVQKSAIGLFGAVATPYALKFLWSPLLDSLALPGLTPWLGRRRGWILATQLLLAVALYCLALARPDHDPWLTAFAALFVAFGSASQDIVIDAYRVERLDSETQGQGAAMAQLGYQLGIIVAGAGALYLADRLGWQETYFAMTGCLGIGMLTTLLAREPEASRALASRPRTTPAEWFARSVVQPFADFTHRSGWRLVLLFIIAYKLADAFIGRMTSPFFHDMHFAKDDIAGIVKVYGTLATLAGVFLGGALVRRYGTLKVLFLAGMLHAATNLMYVEQARRGADTHFLALSIAVENFTGGVSSAAFVAYLSNLCNLHYTATQYAFLSSLAAFGRTWLATPAGWVQTQLGWQGFFFLSAFLALPGLALALILQHRFAKPNEKVGHP